jgi:hypothetical protein
VKAPSEKKGNKTIELRVHFWTNGIAPQKGEIEPGHCLASGSVHVTTNEAHGLKDKHQAKFNSMAQLPAAIEKAMILAGITMHTSRLETKVRKSARRRRGN